MRENSMIERYITFKIYRKIMFINLTMINTRTIIIDEILGTMYIMTIYTFIDMSIGASMIKLPFKCTSSSSLAF